MTARATRPTATDSARPLIAALAAIAVESPAAMEQAANLAVEAMASRSVALAAGCAGMVLLVEHLQCAAYRHAPRMLGILAAAGPESVCDGIEAALAWAGALVAHDYGVLPSWPPADVALLMEHSRLVPADAALALGCALGELCERNGRDAEFAALVAQLAAVEMAADASPFWRGHWSVTCAWHLVSFGQREEASQRLQAAQRIAADHCLAALASTAALQRARLIEWRSDPVEAVALARSAVARGDPSRTPLWFADQADVHCRVALRSTDFHAAVGHARRAAGYLQAAGVWPGYRATYRVNEAYALLGAGAIDEAQACFAAIMETPMPAFLAQRVRCVADLAVLASADRRHCWTGAHQSMLADALRRLRELEWPGVLPLLPEHVAAVFVRALASGVEVDWVRASIRSRAMAAPGRAPQEWPWLVRVRCLGPFELSTDGEPMQSSGGDTRKAASKPLELLRLLASHGHAAVTVESVAEALWPGDGREGRQKAFDITAARLRRLLGIDAAVQVYDRRVGLSGQCVWSDVQALNDALEDGEAASDGVAIAACIELALALYRGPCLADSRQAWAVEAGERIRARLAALLLRARRSAGVAVAQEREWALRAIAADPLLAPALGVPAR